MISSYIQAVSEHYFSLLIPTAIAFVLFSAIAPLIAPNQARINPLGLIFGITFALVFWPFVIPLVLAVCMFLGTIQVSKILYNFSDKFSRSQKYKDWVVQAKSHINGHIKSF